MSRTRHAKAAFDGWLFLWHSNTAVATAAVLSVHPLATHRTSQLSFRRSSSANRDCSKSDLSIAPMASPSFHARMPMEIWGAEAEGSQSQSRGAGPREASNSKSPNGWLSSATEPDVIAPLGAACL